MLSRFSSCILALMFLFSPFTSATIDIFEFSSEDNRQRYQTFINDLRCPKCQNQSLSGSNSPISKDLRQKVYEMIEGGKTDDEINAFMVERYGNFILYDPPLDRSTYFLWFSPVIALVLGLVWIVFMYKGKSRQQQQTLTEAEKQQLADLLSRYS